MKKEPVTRSKGGWRRKPRRITPFVLTNYWSGRRRIMVLRQKWPGLEPSWMVVDAINRHAGPKPVTLWQCWLMASHLGIKRPVGFRAFNDMVHALGAENAAPRLRSARKAAQPARTGIDSRMARPEATSKLRKVGRKPKPRVPKSKPARGYTPGLSMGPSPIALALDKRRTAQKARWYRNERIRWHFKRGKTAIWLAKRFGLTHWTIYTICDGARQGRRRRKPPRVTARKARRSGVQRT